MTGRMLIVGCGYTGRALAARLLAKGWRVAGTTRSNSGAERLGQMGVSAHLWPGEALGELIGWADHLLVSTPPGPAGDPVIAAARDSIAAHAPHLRWVGYLSTTAVYGDHAGGWVDETTPPAPSTPRGRARLAAERQWQALADEAGLRLAIFRLAGIYGPGRGPLEKVRAGTARPIVKPGQVFGRIHVDDIATVLEASIARPEATGIFNVTDDLPAPPEEVLAFAASLLGRALPPPVAFEEAEMTPMARSFYAESKRVRNDRIKRDLGVRLAWPDYRAGLRALAESGGQT